MFGDLDPSFTSDGAVVLDVAAIERRIVSRLAASLDRDAGELGRELRSCDRDLPVDELAIRPILGDLEDEFAVSLRSAESRRLRHVRELAMLIHARMKLRRRCVTRKRGHA